MVELETAFLITGLAIVIVPPTLLFIFKLMLLKYGADAVKAFIYSQHNKW